MTLFTLAEQIRTCTACPLYKDRLLPCPGDGKSSAKIIIIGEAPSASSDRLGSHKTGNYYQTIKHILQNCNINENNIFLTSVVKCHPQNNKTPTKSQTKTCTSLYLHMQIETISPQLIILLGATALQTFFPKMKMQDAHGKKLTLKDQTFFATYHPAATKRFPKLNSLFQKDLTKLSKITMGL